MTPLKIELTFETEPPAYKTFSSVHELHAYVVYERQKTDSQFRAYCGAFTPEERKATGLSLAKARLHTYASWRGLTTKMGPLRSA